jgi:hypothetical protein
VFSISVKVIRDGQVLARGKGGSPVGANGMRQTAKLAAATEALKAFPAELTESTDAWTEPQPDAEEDGAVKDADWMDLKSAQKKAAVSLGWKMGSWNNGDPTPACSKRWASLSQKGTCRPTVSPRLVFVAVSIPSQNCILVIFTHSDSRHTSGRWSASDLPSDHYVSSYQYYDRVLEHEISIGGSFSDLSLARNVLRLQ